MAMKTTTRIRANNESDSERKSLILDAAAELFAEVEYHGTSMRVIADRAGVSQSLIHYHYDTKEQLFEAVFERHITAVNKKRSKLLKQFIEAGPIVPDRAIEELVEILVKPWVDVTRSRHRPTREFAKFVMRSAYRDDEWSKKIARDHYTEMRVLGVTAFRNVIPEFSDEDAFRAYFFSLSMFYMPLSAPERLTILAGNRTDMTDPKALLEHGIRFAAAGIAAMRDALTRKEAEATAFMNTAHAR